MKLPKALIIYGPTATGKTDLAIILAKKFNGELISADSRQVYKGLDIGTGKIGFDSKVEKHNGYWIVEGIKIHGFDLVNPGEQFTAADFVKFANNSTIRIIEQNKLPMVVGGTGFYIKALISGIGTIGIPANPKLRRKLEKLTIDKLYKELEKVDPDRSHWMNESDAKNPRRLIRAIEIALASQKSKVKSQNYGSSRQARTINGSENLKFKIENYLLLGLTAPNDFLYQKAENWIKERLNKGMIEEVKGLLNRGVDQKWLDNLGLEYRWLSRYLTGKINYETAIERLLGDIHNFIRRQKTWFKQLKGIQLFDISQPSWQGKLEKTVKDWYISHSLQALA